MRRFVKIIFIALFAIGFANASFAQGKNQKSREEMRKEIEEFKIKFIAQEMDLKDDQKEAFAELYSKMNQDRLKAYSQAIQLERKVRKSKEATEEEYAAASKAMKEAKDKDTEITQKYAEKFSTFLSNKQLYKMKEAEDKFRRKMEEMRHSGKGKRKGNPDGPKHQRK